MIHALKISNPVMILLFGNKQKYKFVDLTGTGTSDDSSQHNYHRSGYGCLRKAKQIRGRFVQYCISTTNRQSIGLTLIRVGCLSFRMTLLDALR